MNPLHKAIDLSKEGLRFGGPFGAVVMRGDEVVGEGFNLVIPKHDPTAHAAIIAIRQACQRLKTHVLADCVLYLSCEPCPMCLAAILWAKIETVYYAVSKYDAQLAGFADAEVYEQVMKPPEARRVELIQATEPERVAAQAVLDMWKAQPNKVPY